MKRVFAVIAILLSSCLPVLCQLAQSHPELCGRPDGVVSLPGPLSAISGSDGTDLILGSGRPSIRLSLVRDILEVCPLPDGRLVVFGETMNGTQVILVDVAGAVLDDLWTFDPVLSPDQRWIVYRKHYPRHTELPASDEYLLYDLSKSPAQNRLPEVSLEEHRDVGRTIYPPGWKNESGDNIGAPENQQHAMSRFHWAVDSRAVLFVDRVLSNPRKIVLVTLDERGAPAAFERQITVRDVCGREIPGVDPDTWTMDRAEVGPDRAGARSIVLDLRSSDPRCAGGVLELYKGDFQPAKTETRVIPKPTRKAKKGDDLPFLH